MTKGCRDKNRSTEFAVAKGAVTNGKRRLSDTATAVSYLA